MSVVRANQMSTSLPIKYNRGSAFYGISDIIYTYSSYTTSLQNKNYPHDHDFTQAGNKTGGNFAWGYSEETTSNFGIHYSPSPTFPVHLAIYFGNQYSGGVQIQDFSFIMHANHFSTFELQGSNDSGSDSGFCNNGNWTTIASGNAPCTTELQQYNQNCSTLQYFTAIRLKITNGELGTGGLASYYWRLNGVYRTISSIIEL